MPDLSEIKPTERAVDIVHPVTKKPVGLRVMMMPFDDDRLSRIKRDITNRRLSLEQKGKPWKAEDIEENKFRLTFAALTGWEWYDPTPADERGADYKNDPLTFHGEQPTFTPLNYKRVTEELTWVRDQVDEELGDTEAFFA